MSKVWNMIQRIKGKGTNSTVKHLNCDDDILTSKKDIANALAKSMSKVSSAANYDPIFKSFKTKQEQHNSILPPTMERIITSSSLWMSS